MYAVIFRAQTKSLDDAYLETAEKLRQLALDQYGCTDFTSLCDENTEIAISYWPSLEHIQDWKNDKIHLDAQIKGRNIWYQHYQVEIVEIIRRYTS